MTRRFRIGASRQAGFSMLEVIAALVILSLGASVAFTWLSQTVLTIGRLRTQEAELIARIDAVEYLRAINPHARPSGSTRMSQYRVDWNSAELQPSLTAKGRFNSNGIYKVGLYTVKAQIYDPDGRPWFDLDLPVAGYEQVTRAADVNPLQLAAPPR